VYTHAGPVRARARGRFSQSDQDGTVSRNVFDSYNAAYVQGLFDQYLQNPGAVDPAWRALFDAADETSGLLGAERGRRAGAADAAPARPTAPGAEPSAPTIEQLRAARAAGELVDAYRLHGHRAARVDPLGSTPHGHPQLDPSFHGTSAEALAELPAFVLGAERGDTMADVLESLWTTYTGSIGYEYEYLEDPQSREWLREQIESGAHLQPLGESQQSRLLERLTEVEALEQFIHRAYLGAKRFSIEGTDMMVPMLDLAIERAGGAGAREVVIGMAHRGRLNVLAHVLGMPYAELIEKFEGRHAQMAGTGDVKYHLGAEGTYATPSGEPLTVLLAPNPSHLEFVNAIVAGMTRAKQSDRHTRTLRRDEDLVVPIVIHGDAAFSGQGVVPETLNLARLAGYRVGGTLHIIANNQVGFTTNPSEARSTDYSSDLARGFDVPVFHVNADDPEACLAVTRLAMMYRERFHSDVVIDLIGYRRYGHNEADEPAYTQPVMYQRIAEHPTVRKLWAKTLTERGAATDEQVEAVWTTAYQRLVAEQTKVRESEHVEHGGVDGMPPAEDEEVATTVPADRLHALDAQLHRWPDDFTVHPKLVRQLERRGKLLGDGQPIDWAHAEALAFASLLSDGVPIRMTGQDSERGTFSQRHLVLHDAKNDARYAPIENLDDAGAPFEIHNSPLSELAVMGFEYGYSVVTPRALVLWEAQFGDFVNGAQVILDQFLASGRAKWAQESRLLLLLPHGHEGQGPEHSSARLERFLQLAAEDNIRVANCTTAAQYFHLLRRQALLHERRPLIVMTPKSLLRHPRAGSALEALADGSFRRTIDDADARARAAEIRRVLLCSGKVYYDLLAGREEHGTTDSALIRVEQLYPFPADELAAYFAAYGAAEDVVWVQEEPENNGAWRFVRPQIEALLEGDRKLRYIGRPERASPAEGYAHHHESTQKRIVGEAVGEPVRAKAGRGGRGAHS
jgi:2-oxoglutarate dehydrogenase E1 component